MHRAALLGAVVVLLAAASLHAGRQFRCACAQPLCPDAAQSTCVTEHQCFTQFITDSVQPLAYGCLPGRTQLLCESWVHRIGNLSEKSTTPSVVCCDTDLCNRPNQPMLTTISANSSKNFPQNLLTQLIAAGGRSTSTPHRTSYGILYPLDKPLVIAALFVGLFLLLSVLTFGFYLLHKQSQTVKEIWKNRTKSDINMSLMDVATNNC